MRKPYNVLMVTGVYHPEINGASNQCRQVVNTLKNKVGFKVLTTTRNPNLSSRCKVDGIDVFRILLRNGNMWDYCRAICRFATFFFPQRKNFQIVHLHGFSRKSVLLTFLSRIFHKKIIVKMTLIEHDDPFSMRNRGFLLNYFFTKANAYIAISPELGNLYYRSKIPANRLRKIPNGVDTNRFRPVSNREKALSRDQLRLPRNMKLILFVGHFSRQKSPDILVKAWKQYLSEKFLDSGIVFIGSTNPDHFEVDADLVYKVQDKLKPYIKKRIFFIERTNEIEIYFRAVDIFVLPSLREGLPNALLEAMACGLPVVASRIDRVTDWIIADGVNGVLVEPNIMDDLGRVMSRLLNDNILAESLGKEARKTILKRFTIGSVGEKYDKLYRELIPAS